MLTKLANGMIDILVVIINGILALLPDTPFTFEDFDWGPLGDAIGFVFPIPSMLAHLTALLTAFAIYYSVRWLLRLIRAVQ